MFALILAVCTVSPVKYGLKPACAPVHEVFSSKDACEARAAYFSQQFPTLDSQAQAALTQTTTAMIQKPRCENRNDSVKK